MVGFIRGTDFGGLLVRAYLQRPSHANQTSCPVPASTHSIIRALGTVRVSTSTSFFVHALGTLRVMSSTSFLGKAYVIDRPSPRILEQFVAISCDDGCGSFLHVLKLAFQSCSSFFVRQILRKRIVVSVISSSYYFHSADSYC